MRILVFGMTENPGGVESFLVNYYRHINRNDIQFDFLCNSYEPVAYENELIELGGRCFHIVARSVNYRKYKSELETLFKEHASEWDAIWVNVCSLANIDYLKIAKKYGIKRRIIHSHNSQNMDSKLRGLLHFWNKLHIGNIATDFWACSEDAAKWFYSGKEFEKRIVIHNAIDVDRLKFNESKRNELREQYGWLDKIVIGNVGRLHFQKNQSFALEIFKKVLNKNKDCELVFVGQGDDEKTLRSKAEELGISTNVHFVGLQKDICAWLSCFDVFLFPSLFEGLSIAALEAQANGVPVLASKGVIPEEVKMVKNFKFFELNDEPTAWAEELLQVIELGRIDFESVKNAFVVNGYDIENETVKLESSLKE